MPTTQPASQPGKPVEDEDTRYSPDARFQVRVELAPDSSHDNPRDFTNVGVMVLSKHRRYALPREGDLVSEIDERLSDAEHGATVAERIEALAAWLKAEHGATVVLPVWAYDHGELHLKAGERIHPFDDRWDSALAGVIYDTPHTREVGPVPLDRIEEALVEEVDIYDKWARGEVYQYVIERRDANGWNQVVTGSGYYSADDARKAAEAEIESDEFDAEHGGQAAPGEPVEIRPGRRGWHAEVLDTLHGELGRVYDSPPAELLTDDELRVVYARAAVHALAAYLPEGDPLRTAITDQAPHHCRYCGAGIRKLGHAGAQEVNQAHPADEDGQPVASVGDWVTGRAGIKCPEADSHEPAEDTGTSAAPGA